MVQLNEESGTRTGISTAGIGAPPGWAAARTLSHAESERGSHVRDDANAGFHAVANDFELRERAIQATLPVTRDAELSRLTWTWDLLCQPAVCPVAVSTWPVTNEALADARNTMARAISSGSPTAPAAHPWPAPPSSPRCR